MTSALRRTVLVAAAAVSIALVIATAAAVRRDQLIVGTLIVLALAWAAVPPTVDALTDRRSKRVRSSDHGSVPFTSIVRVGDEPADVVRTSVILAAAAGPTIVATTGRREVSDVLARLGIRECVATDMEAAVRDAAAAAETPAVLVLSASAFPRTDACRAAAARLDGDVGWVVGRSEPFNADGYAPEARDVVSAALRTRARRTELDLWEREAVIVRTDLLVAHPPTPGRPLGAFLRRLRRAGFAGAEHAALLTRRASPAGADAYWSAAVARKRGAAADLADAIRTTAGLQRLTAAALLMRELHAYPLLIWLATPALIHGAGSFPFRWSPSVFATAVTVAALLRWFALRCSVGVPLRPASDALALAYDTPASLLALPAVSSRTVRPTRLRLPDRPLVWFALLVTLLLTFPLVDRSHESPTSAIVGALVILAAIWALAMRALLQRTWERSTYRFSVEWPVTVNGVSATTVDASPSGLAVAGDLAGVAPTDTVELVVTLPGAQPLAATGRVVNRHRSGDRDVLGLAIEMTAEDQLRWLTTLFQPAASTPPTRSVEAPRSTRSGMTAVARVGERAVLALVGAAAVVAMGALLLVLVGYRPLVVRSESMVPTLRVGDVAIVEDVPARSLQVDDIVTFPDPEDRGDSVTHRVRAVDRDGNRINFETQGDANDASEFWSAGTDETLGRFAWKVPTVGRAVVALSQPATRVTLGAMALAALALSGFDTFVVRRRAQPGR